jgi:transcriptional regulator with XRE-family HTH domain
LGAIAPASTDATERVKGLGLTHEKLAWEAGMDSKGYLSRIESGQRLPSLDALDRLARRLDVEPRDLLLFPEHDPVAAAMERFEGQDRKVRSG